MKQVTKGAGTSVKAAQPAIPQIASRVRPFNSEEEKEEKECRKADAVTLGDKRHGNPSLGPQNAIRIPNTVEDIDETVLDTAQFEREFVSRP